MNQSFYETRAREKISNLRKEGMMSQAYYRSHPSKANILPKLPRLIIITLGILGFVQLFLR